MAIKILIVVGIGHIDVATLTDCYNTGNICAEGASAAGISGGGSLTKVTSIARCYSSGTITMLHPRSDMRRHYGGIMAWTNAGTITDCYACSTDKIFGVTNGYCNVIRSSIITAEKLKELPAELGDKFAVDKTGINKGFPILKWQVQSSK